MRRRTFTTTIAIAVAGIFSQRLPAQTAKPTDSNRTDFTFSQTNSNINLFVKDAQKTKIAFIAASPLFLFQRACRAVPRLRVPHTQRIRRQAESGSVDLCAQVGGTRGLLACGARRRKSRRIVADSFHLIRLVCTTLWNFDSRLHMQTVSPFGSFACGKISFVLRLNFKQAQEEVRWNRKLTYPLRKRGDRLKAEERERLEKFFENNPAIKLAYEFKERLCELLPKIAGF